MSLKYKEYEDAYGNKDVETWLELVLCELKTNNHLIDFYRNEIKENTHFDEIEKYEDMVRQLAEAQEDMDSVVYRLKILWKYWNDFLDDEDNEC